MLRAQMFRSLIPVLMIKERNLRGRNKGAYNPKIATICITITTKITIVLRKFTDLYRSAE